jgi:hypothetical protein
MFPGRQTTAGAQSAEFERTLEVAAMTIPGFTAEHSLHQAGAAFHAGVSRNSVVPEAEITPQLVCWWDGPDLICGEPPFGGGVNPGGNHFSAQCRSHCFHTKKGKALAACLAEC